MEIDDLRRERIIVSYPLLYPENFFFECRDGWLDLIEDLSDNLETLIEEFRNDYPGDELPMAFQAKEKHGMLDFSLIEGTIAMWEQIDMAKARSREICEICGEKGSLICDGKLKVRCEQHKSK